MGDRTIERLRAELSAPEQYKEIWREGADGSRMCALINGATGWLMYLPDEESSGFSSRNPNYSGPSTATLDYQLSNGQVDEYPLSWALPLTEIQGALEYYVVESRPAPWICWHDDSEMPE